MLFSCSHCGRRRQRDGNDTDTEIKKNNNLKAPHNEIFFPSLSRLLYFLLDDESRGGPNARLDDTESLGRGEEKIESV